MENSETGNFTVDKHSITKHSVEDRDKITSGNNCYTQGVYITEQPERCSNQPTSSSSKLNN
jgi:hypothetical protein